MIRNLLVAGLLGLAFTAPALADGKIYVPLPDLSMVKGKAAEALLHDVVLANVVSSNCDGFSVTDEEWSLLTDSADILAREQLGLSIEDYDRLYYGPAFAALDKADTCETAGPLVQPTLDRRVELGGSRDALPDQEAAYQAMQERQARWDAMVAGPAAEVKTKNK